MLSSIERMLGIAQDQAMPSIKFSSLRSSAFGGEYWNIGTLE